MNKILIIPDSFKGTMSSREVGRILEEEARACWPKAEVTRVEVADGGEAPSMRSWRCCRGKSGAAACTAPLANGWTPPMAGWVKPP